MAALAQTSTMKSSEVALLKDTSEDFRCSPPPYSLPLTVTHPPRDNTTLNKSQGLNPALTNGNLGSDLHDEVLRGGVVNAHPHTHTYPL